VGDSLNPSLDVGQVCQWLSPLQLFRPGAYILRFCSHSSETFEAARPGLAEARAERVVSAGVSAEARSDCADAGAAQIEGAFIQGMGLFTLEEMVWMKNGQVPAPPRSSSTGTAPPLERRVEDRAGDELHYGTRCLPGAHCWRYNAHCWPFLNLCP
jgi:hypothetical protein